MDVLPIFMTFSAVNLSSSGRSHIGSLYKWRAEKEAGLWRIWCVCYSCRPCPTYLILTAKFDSTQSRVYANCKRRFSYLLIYLFIYLFICLTQTINWLKTKLFWTYCLFHVLRYDLSCASSTRVPFNGQCRLRECPQSLIVVGPLAEAIKAPPIIMNSSKAERFVLAQDSASF